MKFVRGYRISCEDSIGLFGAPRYGTFRLRSHTFYLRPPESSGDARSRQIRILLSRTRYVHFSQAIVKSRIATKAVPLWADGKIHQRGITKGKCAIQLLEGGIHLPHSTVKNRTLNEECAAVTRRHVFEHVGRQPPPARRRIGIPHFRT